MSAQRTPGATATGTQADGALLQRWSELPTYLHFFTVGYFATNFFNIWAYNEMAPHWIVGVLGAIGFIGGLAEHLTPYIPKLTIPVQAEKLLFRLTTIAASFAIFFALDPWLPWAALIVGWAVYFWRAPGLSSLGLGFHVRHFGLTHVGGTCGTLVWLMVFDGGYPSMTRFYTDPLG